MSIKLVRRHGSAFWYVRGSLRGKSVDESTGLAEREKAEVIRTRIEWEIITGQQRADGRAAPTFLDAAVSYLEAGKEARFVQPVLDYFGTTPLSDIGQANVEACAKKLYPGRARSTINRQVFTPVAAILRHAAVRGMVERKVFERPKQPNGRIRWLTQTEAERLISECAPHLRPLVIFLLYTGARVGEAVTLDWRNVDLPRAHAAFLDTKNGTSRGVPLHPRVVAELSELKGQRGIVFRTAKGEPYSDREGGGHIKTGFRAACRRAKIANFRPHDCRHTWATWYYAETRDLTALMALGGWKSIAMVSRYAHVNVANLAASVSSLPWGESGDSLGTMEISGSKNSEKPNRIKA